MHKLQFRTPLTEDSYIAITALRGPDNQVLADALKWVITGRIRFYVSFTGNDPRDVAYTVRMDKKNYYRWQKAHEAWDRLVKVGVPKDSLHHWALHAKHALQVIRRKCLAADDNDRECEILAMLELLQVILGAHKSPSHTEGELLAHDLLSQIQRYASLSIPKTT